MTSLSFQYRVGQNTISKIIPEVCRSIWKTLQPEVIPDTYTVEKWKQTSTAFLKKWHMPHCIGALDGKHVIIQAPPHSGSDYFNYKGQHSLVLIALCDADYKFIFVEIGSQGRQSDGGIFRRTSLYRKIKTDTLNIPEPEIIDGDIPIPYYIVGDAAFPLLENIMRPFPGNFLPQKKRIFNYR